MSARDPVTQAELEYYDDEVDLDDGQDPWGREVVDVDTGGLT